MKALLFFANGFEETEAIGTLDVLLRGGIDVRTVSITDDLTVEGAHGQKVIANTTISEVKDELVDALVLPGGMPGAANLAECSVLRDMLIRHHAEGKLVSAICAAPMALAKAGLLDGIDATCYPGFESELPNANHKTSGVVKVGQIITGRGPGYVFDFGLAILASLAGQSVADEVAAGLLLGGR